MSVDRRRTCARCFVYGDVRSVESSLEMFDAWRDPRVPSRRVAQVVLAGEGAHVLGTAQGIRDIERLRGERFGFALAASERSARRGARLECAVVDEFTAQQRGRDALLLVDPDEAIETDAAGRRALKNCVQLTERDPSLAVVAVLRHGATLARSLAQRVGRGRTLDVVRFDGENPLLLPMVEGVLADAQPSRILVGGRGARLLGAALGAGDFFLERAGDPRLLGARERAAQTARAVVVRSLCHDAPPLASVVAIEPELARLGVARVEGAYDADAEGVLVYPVPSAA